MTFWTGGYPPFFVKSPSKRVSLFTHEATHITHTHTYILSRYISSPQHLFSLSGFLPLSITLSLYFVSGFCPYSCGLSLSPLFSPFLTNTHIKFSFFRHTHSWLTLRVKVRVKCVTRCYSVPIDKSKLKTQRRREFANLCFGKNVKTTTTKQSCIDV